MPAKPARDHALERAIRRDEIQLRFQPQIDIASGAVTGVEALARWEKAESAEALFDRAEASGLSERLSRAIQRKALQAASRWSDDLSRMQLSINLLPQDLERQGFERWLLEEIRAAGLEPQRVTAEIVETSLVGDRLAVAARLSQLRAAGVRIAIDDFGTGYSSLAYLASLPLDAIKIDRAMIAHLIGGSRDRIIVKAMVRLAQELGLKVIVEGVESPDQLALLRQWGCDSYQGFLGSKALGEVELARFVAANLPKAA